MYRIENDTDSQRFTVDQESWGDWYEIALVDSREEAELVISFMEANGSPVVNSEEFKQIDGALDALLDAHRAAL